MGKLSLRSIFTKVAGKDGRIKAINILLLVILCCFYGEGYAAVSVTAASGGTLICSSKANGGSAPAFTTLGAITITEGNAADIFGPATEVVVLTAPAGWQFNPASPVSFGFITGSNVYTVAGTVTSTTLTINISVNGIDGYDQVQVTGLQVQATSTSSTAGNIYCTSITGGSIAGIVPGSGAPNFGSLSLTPPVVPSVTVAASPAGPICAGTNVVFTPTPVGGGATPSYQWYLNGVSLATGSTYANTNLVNGNTVYCVMTSSGSCVTTVTATSATSIMTVNPDPSPIAGSGVTCIGGTTTMSDATASGTWSSSNMGIATIDASGNVAGIAVGTSIITYFAAGCPSTITLTVNNPPLAPVLSPTLTTLCSGGVATITATGAPAPSAVLSQTFNSGLGSWTVDNSGGSGMLPGGGWKVCGNGYPTLGPFFSPDYSAFAMSNADTSPSTSFTSSKLISPVFSLAAYSGATLTFQQAYEYWPAGDFNVELDISTDGGTTWTTMQNFVGASIGTSTGFVGETFSLNAYLGQPNLRIRFYYYTHWGDFWAIDNVLVTGTSSIVMPTWSPVTDLYADAGLTTPYVPGTPDDTVYVHPPSITTTGTITYTATATSSGCAATSNSSVNFTPSPSPITGNASICVGTSTNLSDITTAGTWTSGNTSTATVVPGTGVVTGASPGTVTISYGLGSGCTATTTVTVNISPGAISGARGICLGASGSLSDPATTGGTWVSSNTAIATIGSTSGSINTVATGTATITYTIGAGCFTTTVITVNPLPTPILGTAKVCMGLSTDLSDATSGGTWMSGSPAIVAAGTGSGTVFGLAVGTANVTYTLGTGCITTRIVTVNPLYPITGTTSVCAGTSTNLTDAATGGTWSSNDLSVATAAAGTGSITGVSQGFTTISYVLPTGCTATANFTVNPLPVAISGNAEVCVNAVTTLTDATSGGVWSSGNTGIALIGPTTGTVAGISAGTSLITYQLTATGCLITTIATVDPLPAAIAGTRTVCAGLTTQLSDSSPGGTWSSNDITTATIAVSGGLVTGVAANTVVITYTLPTGCTATTLVTVNPLPTAIIGNPQVCVGSAMILSDASAGGTWTSSSPTVATITSSGIGIVIGYNAGTTIITYALATGCITIVVVTVNPLPGVINGAGAVCTGSVISLTDASAGGTWSSSNSLIATISSTGTVSGVSAGPASIIYTLPTACTATKTITVNPLPVAISGNLTTCVGQSTTLTDGTGGGTWSSGNVFFGTVGSASGSVTGINAGTVNITYTLATGCLVNATVTVNALPPAISGGAGLCQGATTTLSDAVTGGTWVSGNTSVVFIGSSSGFVIGVSTGTANVTYTDGGTGCAISTIVTVNPLPAVISGASVVCTGAAISLSDGSGGGTWASSNTSVATVSSGGIVTGISTGTVSIVYTLPTGCTAVKVLTVNQTPSSITGTLSICQGTATILSDAYSSGTWSSGTTSVAIVGAGSGVTVGLSSGTSNITYTLTGNCSAVSVITVNLAPGSITGAASLCAGSATVLSDASAGGSWSSSNTVAAAIGSGTGIVTGLSAGNSVISYTLPDGCASGFAFTVNTMPAAITGTTTICQGLITNLSDAVAGGGWSSSNTAVVVIGSGTGVAAGVGVGTAIITYGYPTGCRATTVVTTNATPAPVSGNSNVCLGFTTTFSDGSTGGTWSSSNTGVATIGATGLVNTVSVGSATISYSFASGCAAVATLYSNPQPSVIDGTTNICAGSVTTLTDSIGSGNWSSSNPSVATVGSTSGLLSGNGGGTATITYSLGAGCITTTVVTVNLLPSSVSGTSVVCAGASTSLSDPYAGGGTWSSSDVSIATVGSASGIVNGVNAGTVTITYSLGPGCTLATVVTVNPLPATITEAANLCYGATTLLNDAIAGGTWNSSNSLIAPVGLTSGIIAGSATGTVTVTYKLGTGCLATSVVTVYPIPGNITGAPFVCAGLTTSLSDGTSGGVWSSANVSVATVGSTSGIVSGIVTGTASISYILATGCGVSVTATVNPLPAGITGTMMLCAGTTTNLTDASTGGGWSSSNTAVALVGSATGIVSGVGAGTASITYTLPTGCTTTAIVTVIPIPAAITGGANVCVGSTINLSDATGGGAWSSDNTSIAWIGTGSGILLGVSAGTTMITYVVSTGCINNIIVTVTALPPAISGPAGICVGATAVLTDAVTPGTWATSNIGVAAIGSSTGNVMGITGGTANITYTIPIAPGIGCSTHYTITVNPVPLSISGVRTVCSGLMTALSDVTAGGTWSSSNASVATVGTSGIVTGNIAATATIFYTIPASTGGGCATSVVVTVNPLPAAITGTFYVCAGSATNLSDASAGGTWSSLNVGVASISLGTGIATGNLGGTATIVYTLPTSCISSQVVTVNPMPSVISGASSVCQGLSTMLSDATGSGTWASNNPSVAVINASTGNLTGISAGAAIITYALSTGCYVTTPVTVNPLPSFITGNTVFCVGLTTNLSDVSPGGAWSSGDVSVATAATTGIITGVATGVDNITYMLPTGCIASITVTVNTMASISGNPNICSGYTTMLSDATGAGTWSSSNVSAATVGSLTGVVTGVSPGTSAISYVLSAGCIATAIVTVNSLPSPISGTRVVCAGLVTTLSDAFAGGTWASNNLSVGTVDLATGSVRGISAGTTTITYTIGTGCTTYTNVTVNPLPAMIGGTTEICHGLTTSLTDVTSGGIWSSSNPSIAAIGTTGIVTGSGTGSAIVTYTLPTGCLSTVAILVDPLPSPVSGVASGCAGLTVTLTDASSGGTWSSTGIGILSVASGTGAVTGISAGTAIVTYTLPTGCVAKIVFTVNPLPAAIAGATNVCAGLTVALTDITTGGAWSSSDISVAIVGAGTGTVGGASAGTAMITYMLPTTGCIATTVITVNPLPQSIDGVRSACLGLTTNLSDSSSGGTWSTGLSGIASIGSLSGLVTGIASGVGVVTYTLPTGCITVSSITVNPLPAVITGPANVCAGLTINLSDATAGGSWSSGSPGVAVVGSAIGIVTGISAGTVFITYTLNTGCINTVTITVNPLPASITGGTAICAGAATALSDATAGGLWSSGAPGIATVGVGSGIVSGLVAGVAGITYTLTTGCISSATITVNPLPASILGTLHVCAGLFTPLSDPSGGGTWSSGAPGTGTVGATGIVTGIAAGTTVITYAFPTGCAAMAAVTVNPLPAAIDGAFNVCTGSTVILSDITGGGSWSITAPAIATIGSATGAVAGVSAGTTIVTYTLSTGCIATTTETVFASPSPVTGTLAVCAGLTTALTDPTGGGTWSSSNYSSAIVGGTTGVVTGISSGTSVISYTLGTGCFAFKVVTINPLPAVVSGASWICTGVNYSLSDSTSGGNWSSGTPSVATVNSLTGLLHGVATGNTVITYTLPTGCINTLSVTVNASPAGILGTTHVCAGAAVTLSDVSAGGAWSSSNSATAVVSSGSGTVNGISAGSVAITYELPTGCTAIVPFTVNPLPSIIAGNRSICLGSTSGFSDTLTGGAWSVASSAIATIGGVSGIATGVALGNTTITYTLPTGCAISAIITVNPYPVAIIGASLVCQGYSIDLSDGTSGGGWSSNNTAIASVGPASGVVTGVSGGATTISYTMSTGCFVTKTVTVNPLFPITGVTGLCVGSAYTFSDLATGGTWNSSTATVVSIGSATGAAIAVASGVTIISYSLPSGCSAAVVVTVNVLPVSFNVTGGGSYCAGGTGLSIELNGSDTGIHYDLYNGSSFVVADSGTGGALFYGPYMAAGTYTVLAVNDITGCRTDMNGSDTISITPISVPSVGITTTIGDTVCEGSIAIFKAIPSFGGSSPLYHWFVNGVSVGVPGPDSSYTYSPVNGDNVSVTMASDAVCVMPATASATFSVTTTPDIAPSVTISASPGDSICATYPVTMIPDPVNGGSLPTYRWMKNGINAGWGSTYSYLPLTGDNIICVIHSNYHCLSVDTAFSNNINITVIPLLTPAISIAAYPGGALAPGQPDTLVAAVTSGGIGVTYQWYIDGIAVPGAVSDTFISSSLANNDTVSCITSGVSNCGTVTAENYIVINVNNTEVQQMAAGIRGVSLIPNPNNGTFTIYGLAGAVDEIFIEITDIPGQKVFGKTIKAVNGKFNEKIELDNSLANGVYLMNLSAKTSSTRMNENVVLHFIIRR